MALDVRLKLAMIRKSLGKFSDWGIKRLYRSSVIATIEGVPIVSARDDHDDFLRIISRSFDLLRTHDLRRFQRVVSTADWIVDCSLPLGARTGLYRPRFSSIEMDFDYSEEFGDELYHAGYYAGLLVHEGTHELLFKRGFEYSEETRIQEERICVAEENRFLARLDIVRDNLGHSLQREFDASNWHQYWSMKRGQIFKEHIKRIRQKERQGEQSVPPKSDRAGG